MGGGGGGGDFSLIEGLHHRLNNHRLDRVPAFSPVVRIGSPAKIKRIKHIPVPGTYHFLDRKYRKFEKIGTRYVKITF